MNTQQVRTLFTGLSMFGVAATAGMAAHDAKRAEELPEDSTIKTKMIYIGKNYWRTIVVCGSTVIAIGVSHKIGTKQVVMITSIAAGTQQLYSRYDDKIKEFLGEEKRDEIKKAVIKDNAEGTMVKYSKMDIEHGEDEEFFYEPITDQYFYSTKERILKAQVEINRRFHNDPEDFESQENQCTMAGVNINDWLELIGAETVDYGKAKFGWFWGDGDGFWDYNWSFFGGPFISVSFDEITEGDDKYYILDYGPMPANFMDMDSATVPYQKEITDAMRRWENEYA